MTSVTPPGKTAHTFTYNLFELIGSYLPPTLSSSLSGATTYSYNLDRQLIQVNKPSGIQINYAYDASSGHLTSITDSKGAYNYTYLPASSLLSSISTPEGETTSFNSYAGNLVLKTSNSGNVVSSLSYSYNVDGTLAGFSISGKTGPTQSQTFTYDKDGLIASSGALMLTRNNFGAVAEANAGKISESISYDSYGEISSDQLSVNEHALSSETFTRNTAGEITAIGRAAGLRQRNQTFAYDSVGRVKQVREGGREKTTYTYDANGNRLTKSGPDFEMIRGVYNAQDQLVQYGNADYTYDADGNLVSKVTKFSERRRGVDGDRDDHSEPGAREVTYGYNVFGLLKAVNLPDGRKISYAYDGKGRRVGKFINGTLVKGYVYQSQTQIVAELDSDGRIDKQFVYGTKVNSPDLMITGGRTYRIISDQVGTPMMIVDAKDGREVSRMNFDEFGIPQFQEGRISLPFGFAGGLFDQDTGLVRFGARDYDPATGRFISKDPLLFGGGDTNLYGYVANDPVNFMDPRGLWAIAVGPSVSGILGGGFEAGGGIYFGTTASGGVDIGVYGSGGSGFGVNIGASVGASYYPNTDSIAGNTTNYNLGVGPVSGTFQTPGGSCSAASPNSSSAGTVGGGYGWRYGASVTDSNTGTFGVSNIINFINGGR